MSDDNDQPDEETRAPVTAPSGAYDEGGEEQWERNTGPADRGAL